MKLSFLPMSFLVLSLNCFALSDKEYRQEIEFVNSAEARELYKAGALRAASAANKIAEDSQFDAMVISIDTNLSEQREEVISGTSKGKAGLSLFGLFSASGSYKFDTVKILTTNADEVDAFSRKEAREFKKLQKKLQKFVRKNEPQVLAAKLFAAKAIELASKLPAAEIAEVYSVVTKAAQRVSKVSFIGLQNVQHCITTDHARSSRRSKVELSALVAWISAEKKETTHAYSETSCESRAVQVSSVVEGSYELLLADEYLESASDSLSLKILNEAEAPYFPTWGSSDYSN